MPSARIIARPRRSIAGWTKPDFGKRRIVCPLLVLWGRHGILDKLYDPVEIWRGWADDVRGQAIDSGHYLAEERPEETSAALLGFFRE
jgi:haloacetate dehalogenase